MYPSKIHIIHVGPMSNKGTQALLFADVSTIKKIVGDDVSVSVSTYDVEGVEKLDIPLYSVLPTVLDIPFVSADLKAKRLGISRNTFRYKILVAVSFIVMFIQTIFALASIFLLKLGLKPLFRSEVLERMKACDLIVSCSDENFKETASLLPLNVYWLLVWWSVLFERMFEISVAKFFEKPVVMFPNSVGPFRTPIGRFLSRISLNNCNRILIRDPISYNIVESLNIRPPKVFTCDTALLFNTEKETAFEDVSHPILGVCPGVYSHTLPDEKVERDIEEYALALDLAIDKYGFSVVFLPHYITGSEDDDLETCKLIAQKMENKDCVKIVAVDDVREFKFLLDKTDLIISSKMHPAILGTSGYVPTLSIAYDHKQTGFYERLKMEEFVITLQESTHEKIFSKINLIWGEKEEIINSLRIRVPELQDDIMKAITEALTFYEDK